LTFERGDTYTALPLRSADAHPIFAALHFKFSDPAVVYYCDQFSYLFNCHGIRF